MTTLGCTLGSVFGAGPSDYRPHVVIVGLHKYHPYHRDSLSRGAEARATALYSYYHVTGAQESPKPKVIVTSPDNRFSLAIGGYVNMRVGYDFEGIVDSRDFVTYDIPTSANYTNRQKLIMDPTTSRLYFKGIARTRLLGDVITYIETDFRGYRNNLRLRQAYVSFKGFLFGQAFTTFCDLDASPTTVDFQGPNAYNLNFNAMIRYTHTFGRMFKLGDAAEMPQISATYVDTDDNMILQRIPDFILYAQVQWGQHSNSHVRATGVIRDLFYRDLTTNKNLKRVAWGAQLSGNVHFARRFDFVFNGVIGKGITPYIQDITGSGLDLVPAPDRAGLLQMPTMWGWFAAMKVNLTPRIFVSGGYSAVRVILHKGYSDPSAYKRAEYVFGNVFYSLTPNCQIALEYLYGVRKDQNGDKGHANRLQAMIQYNF